MGHKVHPVGFRIGVIRDWQAKWYADRHYAEFLQEDLKLRQAIQAKYGDAAISQVEIEREANQISITVHTARPGIVIGRGGQRVDETRAYLEHLIGKKVQLNIREIQQPELDAYLVAKIVAEQMERRVAYRRAMKQALQRTMQAGARGMKISCGGRLGGAEIARRLSMHEGQVPLHTLRADIDYGFTEARTTMGRIGVKVWIYKGEVLPEPKTGEEFEEAEELAAESVAEASVEAVPATEVSAEEAPVGGVSVEEKAARPVRKRKAAAEPVTESAGTEEAPVAEVSVEEVPATEPEEAPAKPRRRRTAKAASSPASEESVTEVAAEASTEAEPVEPGESDVTT